jgi:hypothetical protein
MVICSAARSCVAAPSMHQAGPVQHVKVQHDAETNKKGFGFITYAGLVRSYCSFCSTWYNPLCTLLAMDVAADYQQQLHLLHPVPQHAS